MFFDEQTHRRGTHCKIQWDYIEDRFERANIAVPLSQIPILKFRPRLSNML